MNQVANGCFIAIRMGSNCCLFAVARCIFDYIKKVLTLHPFGLSVVCQGSEVALNRNE